MVVAMLIAPGSIAYQLTDRLPIMLGLSAFFGGLSAALGFLLAFYKNWPAGPSMTVVAGMMFFLTMIFSPKYGVFFRHLRQWQKSRRILEEDILKSIARCYPKPLEIESLQNHLGVSKSFLKKAIRGLSKKDLVESRSNHLVLTGSGEMLATEVLRVHRLWEKFLVDKGVSIDMVHDLAEDFEHTRGKVTVDDLTSEITTDISVDPHGQKIP